MDLFLLFPPPGVFGATSNSGERFSDVKAFLFTYRGTLSSDVLFGNPGELEFVMLDGSVVFSARLPKLISFSPRD